MKQRTNYSAGSICTVFNEGKCEKLGSSRIVAIGCTTLQEEIQREEVNVRRWDENKSLLEF